MPHATISVTFLLLFILFRHSFFFITFVMTEKCMGAVFQPMVRTKPSNGFGTKTALKVWELV